MEFTVYGQLRSATGEKTIELEPAASNEGTVETVADALERFLEAYPRARRDVLDESGDVRTSVRVLVDGERADLDDACPPDARIQLFPAMQGGRR
ncbi:ubiquitin-like small modifier protein 1 [Natronomonas salsuginis]|uniref:MoaD/ThiS family protein n=1 Tax=Natronomonas salsuginis TaxID=2217661 RepID=A0A4U5JE80_9EURY|nr:ubiquitin-like small modifier protein 1 [Natronomonas salsuginis]TKR25967.1 MoaD/ThiS family protein [Natronomonas salsuginis]